MKILFFSPLCGRTGSELALYHLICNADRTNVKMAVACGARRALTKAFPPDVPVFNYWHALSFADQAFKANSRGPWLANQLLNGMIRLIHKWVRPDAWYINTIGQPHVLALARDLGVPCVLHTHEFEFALSLLKSGAIADLISYPKLVIAASQCAADVLRVFGRLENIEVCYSSIDISRIKIDPQKSKALRQELKIPPDAFVWTMSGTREPNKNPIGFSRIAAELLKHEPNTHFLWIGGAHTAYSLYAEALTKQFKVHQRVHWIPEHTDDYYDYLNIADGFVVTSLNESLSMVTLEAAALGKPFVSFNSGGPKEIFRDGMGVVVDSWNTKDMVAAMLRVMRGEVYLEANISRARAAEFDVSVIVRHWERIMGRYMGALKQ